MNAKIVRQVPWWTKTSTLLKETNWLSIFQLAWYHSLLLIWKVKSEKGPINNYKNLTTYKKNAGRIKLTRQIWSLRAGNMYDTLPLNIKQAVKLSQAKSLLKEWVKQNIPLEEEEE